MKRVIGAIIAPPTMRVLKRQTDYNGRMSDTELSHLDFEGKVTMVDVGGKKITKRMAIARGEVHLQPETIEQVKKSLVKKGDVLTVAQIAGIMGAKRTSDLIPLCHPLLLDQVKVNLVISTKFTGIQIDAEIRSTGKTGAEMEALTAVSIAALTVYDMVKAIDRSASIQNIRMVEKHGGKSGDVINE